MRVSTAIARPGRRGAAVLRISISAQIIVNNVGLAIGAAMHAAVWNQQNGPASPAAGEEKQRARTMTLPTSRFPFL